MNRKCACPKLVFMVGSGISRFSPRTHKGKIGIVGCGVMKTATKKEKRIIVETRIAVNTCLSPLILPDARFFSVLCKALMKARSLPICYAHM